MTSDDNRKHIRPMVFGLNKVWGVFWTRRSVRPFAITRTLEKAMQKATLK